MKSLINIKSSYYKCFLWFHIRYLNPLKIHSEKKPIAGKNMLNNLDYKGIEFPVSRKDFDKIEKKNGICIVVFCYNNNLLYPVNISDKKSKNCMNLLLITDDKKSHYVDFTRFMCNKKKCKNKNHFGKY